MNLPQIAKSLLHEVEVDMLFVHGSYLTAEERIRIAAKYIQPTRVLLQEMRDEVDRILSMKEYDRRCEMEKTVR